MKELKSYLNLNFTGGFSFQTKYNKSQDSK